MPVVEKKLLADNTLSYEKIGWMMDYSADGLYFLVASFRMQQRIWEIYKEGNIYFLDCASIRRKVFSFQYIKSRILQNPDAHAFFILQFDLLLQTDEDISRLNFCRDLLSDIKDSVSG